MFKPEFLLTSLIVVLIPGTGAVYAAGRRVLDAGRGRWDRRRV